MVHCLLKRMHHCICIGCGIWKCPLMKKSYHIGVGFSTPFRSTPFYFHLYFLLAYNLSYMPLYAQRCYKNRSSKSSRLRTIRIASSFNTNITSLAHPTRFRWQIKLTKFPPASPWTAASAPSIMQRVAFPVINIMRKSACTEQISRWGYPIWIVCNRWRILFGRVGAACRKYWNRMNALLF